MYGVYLPQNRAASWCSARARCRSARRANSTTPGPRRSRRCERKASHSAGEPEHRHDPDQRRACGQGLLRRDHAGERRTDHRTEEVRRASCLASAARPRSTAASRWRGAATFERLGVRVLGTPIVGDPRHRGPGAVQRRLDRDRGQDRAQSSRATRSSRRAQRSHEIGLPVMLRGGFRPRRQGQRHRRDRERARAGAASEL